MEGGRGYCIYRRKQGFRVTNNAKEHETKKKTELNCLKYRIVFHDETNFCETITVAG